MQHDGWRCLRLACWTDTGAWPLASLSGLSFCVTVDHDGYNVSGVRVLLQEWPLITQLLLGCHPGVLLHEGGELGIALKSLIVRLALLN